MVDLLLVDCYLPDSPVKQGHFDRTIEGTAAAGLTLSVSNDGIHKSDKNLTFISYDSACMACNVSSGCSLKVSDLMKHTELLCSQTIGFYSAFSLVISRMIPVTSINIVLLQMKFIQMTFVISVFLILVKTPGLNGKVNTVYFPSFFVASPFL